MSGKCNANMPLLRLQQQDLIVISDSEGDDMNESVYIVESEVTSALPEQATQVVDEDLTITFSQRAEVLPHARYDCPLYPFQPTDDKKVPTDCNFLKCEQCYCYVCDKAASQCETWIVAGETGCHCNSHKRSEYWRGLRDARLLGLLRDFNITLTEMDSHLRDAEVMLRKFTVELAQEYSTFSRGKSLTGFGNNVQTTVYDYTQVYECTSKFLNMADSQEDRAAAVMRLGAAKNFMGHFQPNGMSISNSPKANAITAKALLIERVLVSVQRQMVLADFSPEFSGKLQFFYQNLSLPVPLALKRRWSLNLRPWNDILLVSVLKGQNVLGVYKAKGKKADTLVEALPVIILRVQHLQNQRRYRELCRYLNVVCVCAGTQDDQTRFQEVTDLLPLYLCLSGRLQDAMVQFFAPSRKCPTDRLSPFYFQLYLHILETGTAPVLPAMQDALPTQDTLAAAKWEKIQDAVPVPASRLVAFSIRVMKMQKDIFSNAGCWEALLSMVNTPRNSPAPLEKPSPQYLQDARTIARDTLSKATANDWIYLPVAFNEQYPRQGLLLLVTEALAMRIFTDPLEPAIPVANTFKENEWAFQWLCDSLMLYSPDSHRSFMKGLLQELQQSTPTPADNAGTAQASAANASPSSQWLLWLVVAWSPDGWSEPCHLACSRWPPHIVPVEYRTGVQWDGERELSEKN